MKRVLNLFICVIISTVLFASCGNKHDDFTDTSKLKLNDWYYENLSEDECTFLIDVYIAFVDRYNDFLTQYNTISKKSNAFTEPFSEEEDTFKFETVDFYENVDVGTKRYSENYGKNLANKIKSKDNDKSHIGIMAEYLILNTKIAGFAYYHQPEFTFTIGDDISKSTSKNTYGQDYFDGLKELEDDFISSLTTIRNQYFQ